MASPDVKFVFGGGTFDEKGNNNTLDKVTEFLQVLSEEGIQTIDTAQIYGNSEKLLGQAGAAEKGFIIDTKHCGGWVPEQSTRDKVISRGEESLKKLRCDQVDIFYIHAPDRDTPLEETLPGIDTLYRAGRFRRFGLSNFTAEEIEDVIRICRANDYVLPSVYQGSYSAIARKQETEILPTVRKHGMAFYAYSPVAGGLLTKTPDEVRRATTNMTSFWSKFYDPDVLSSALEHWDAFARDARISKAELAYRWITYHSALRGQFGDAIIIGASSINQLRSTLEGLKKGPLTEHTALQIEQVWKEVEKVSPLDAVNHSVNKQ